MMKKVIASLSLLAACTTALAQGYVGALVALSRIDGACAGQNTCSETGHHAMKVYFGSSLSEDHQFDLGIGKIAAVEVGMISFGNGQSTGTAQAAQLDANGQVVSDPNTGSAVMVSVPASRSTSARALTFAAVSLFPMGGGVNGVLRTGAAYVTSTVNYYVQGVENGSETASKLKPYVGLGLEYSVTDNVKVVSAFDWTKFDVAGYQSSLRSFGIGAQVGF
jgi:hypothetical protein